MRRLSQFQQRVLAVALVGLVTTGTTAEVSAQAADDPVAEIEDHNVSAHGRTTTLVDAAKVAATKRPTNRSDSAAAAPAASQTRWESRTVPCGASGAAENCGASRIECLEPGRTPTVTYWRAEGTSEWGSPTPSCGDTELAPPEGPADAEVAVAPPTPSLGQIQEAFRELPFCMPEPTISPPGGKTLINFDTYYTASWPDGSCLVPGEVSDTVTLLSWDIEYRIAAQDYTYDYGDGQTSGATTSTGGPYPTGDVTHQYSDTGTVDVRIDARLTGDYRVNGGAWQDLAATADLQDEPAVPLTVVRAKNRLTK